MATHRVVSRLLTTVAVAGLVAACQTTREQEAAVRPEVAHSFLADKPAALQKHFYVALTQGPRNQVLNDMRLGLASLEMGNDKLAEQLLDNALAQIETVYVDNEHANKARRLFTTERVKDFKGEPYERAMAYYYRGILYMKAGDYDNARASFKGGFLQDSFAEEDQNRADFGLLQYLQGWASRCRGNTVTAEEDFKEFAGIKPDFPLPAVADDTLVLVETGSPPVKYSAGDTDGAKPKYLKYRRASATESARIGFTDQVQAPPVPPRKGEKQKAAPPPEQVSRSIAPLLLEDVYYQASTRGGREFDAILAGKAQFKSVTGTIGDAALVGAVFAASYASNSDGREQRDAAAVAGALLLVGLLAKTASDAAEAEADTRYWDNLPDRVHAVTLALPPSVTSLSVDFLGQDGSVLRTRQAAVTRAGSCGLAWVRGDSALPANPRAPSSAPVEAMFSPVTVPPLPAAPSSSDKPKT